ncbi:MAG: AMP-binding protein [Gammaproteobacteria bacterium]|nr:AMP-binding protein [Gammaproteobacteria bacterium]
MNKLVFDNIHDRHIGRAIRMQAEQNGDTRFLVFDRTVYTFDQANSRVNELAAGLRKLGIERGDRVVFYMSSAPEVMFLVLAVNKLGAIWVPVNSDYKGAWLEDTINRGRAKLLVTDTSHAERVAAVHASLQVAHIAVLGDPACLPGALPFEALYAPSPGEPDLSGFDYGDTCAVLWTSGTTGRSKGVMQSHNVWFQAALDGDVMYHTRAGDVVYNVMPMYNSGAWATSLFRSLFCGVTLAVDPAFSVTSFWDRVRFYGATQSFTIGAMHMFLWNAPPRADDADNPLRELQAVPMPTDIKEPFSKRFGVRVLGQGMSQSEAMIMLRQDQRLRSSWPPGSCGNPVEGMDMKLVDEAGQEVGVGNPGELWVRPQRPFMIFNGYFDDAEATANAFSGAWYHTGDMLRRDAEDNYFFVDRKKDAVRYKGRNISSYEVELVARRHPAIADCAAFGIPSEELQHEDEIKLNVVLRPDAVVEARDIAQYINDNAPYFFVPRYIEFVEELPYTPNQKIQKYRLREAGIGPNTWDARRAGFKSER